MPSRNPQFNAYDPVPPGIGYVIWSTLYVVVAKYKYINDFYFTNNNKYVQVQFVNMSAWF